MDNKKSEVIININNDLKLLVLSTQTNESVMIYIKDGKLIVDKKKESNPL